jgi:hypothetical protein
MQDVLFWLYFSNSVLLILHEIDSAYWKEWELFRLPWGQPGFLLLHVPILAAVLYGLILLREGCYLAQLLSLAVSLSGIFAFCIHSYFLKKGRSEFDTVTSKTILWIILAVSLVQAAITTVVLID